MVLYLFNKVFECGTDALIRRETLVQAMDTNNDKFKFVKKMNMC